jgi:hypothetical protein
MIKLGLERRGVWAKLREARAAKRDSIGWTRLHLACGAGAADDAQRVRELVELGWPGSVEARDNAGWTPLILASHCDKPACLRALLAAGADAGAVDGRGSTALIAACFGANEACARLLVERGADVNATDNNGFTPLSFARGHYANEPCAAIEALLLANGAR